MVSSDAVLRHVAQRSGVHAIAPASSRIGWLRRRGNVSSRTSSSRRLLGDALDPEVRAALERMRRGG